MDSTPVQILPVIVVDPGLPPTNIDMTVEQVLLAQQGRACWKFWTWTWRFAHLVTELAETVDTTLSLERPFSHPTHRVASSSLAGPLG